MIHIKGTVKDRSVKLPDAIEVSDGSHVIITLLESPAATEDKLLIEELENEDVEFVRACRGRLARPLQSANE